MAKQPYPLFWIGDDSQLMHELVAKLVGVSADLQVAQGEVGQILSYSKEPGSILLVQGRALLREKEELVAEPDSPGNNLGIVANTPEMLAAFERISRVARFDTTVLIRGESGTGKELVARAIHRNSPRAHAPFIPINCGAIPEQLIEAELFGFKKGAFTDAIRDKPGLFEEASGGTIFLDEIGEMPPQLQVKLLRALQERVIVRVGEELARPIDVRIVAATHRDLEAAMATGAFREDLYYRINVVSVMLPPLRNRREDIPALVDSFLAKVSSKLSLPICEMSPEALQLLLTYSWPGNVRELENCIERGVVLCQSSVIEPNDLPPAVVARKNNIGQVQFHTSVPEDAEEGTLPEDLSIKTRVRQLEERLIAKALSQTGGNRTHAAKVLEISHRALLYKLKEYGMENVGKD
jgi:two-component system, NtrC family, response regulator AtoC